MTGMLEFRIRPGDAFRATTPYDDLKLKLFVAWPTDEPAPTVATLRAVSPDNPAFLELAPPEVIPSMPAGAAPQPLPGDWAKGIPVNGAGPNSRPALCDVRVLRGWLRLRCAAPGTIPLLRGGYTKLGVKDQDFFMTSQFSTLELVVRLAPGTDRSVTLDLNDKGARLAVRWPDGAPAPSEISLVNVPKGL